MADGIKIISIITVFMFLIIGLNLLPSLSESVNKTQDASDTINNETIAITSGAGQTAQTTSVVATFFGNTTATYTIGTEVNVSTAGVVEGAGNMSDGNYFVIYTYQPTDYIENGPARAIINLVIIFFVIGILAIGMMSIRNIIEEKMFK